MHNDLKKATSHTIVVEFKGRLLSFNGLVYPEGKEKDEKERIKQKMYKLVLADLKEVIDLCDIDRTKVTDKEQLCDLLLNWLEEPKASGKKLKTTPKAKKAKASPKAANEAKKRATAKASAPAKKKAKKKEPVEEEEAAIALNIPGATIEQVRSKVQQIVADANKEGTNSDCCSTTLLLMFNSHIIL